MRIGDELIEEGKIGAYNGRLSSSLEKVAEEKMHDRARRVLLRMISPILDVFPAALWDSSISITTSSSALGFEIQ